MTEDARPVVVAFDGSAEAQEAVRAAVALFGTRRLLVVSVWEPGLAMTMMSTPDTSGLAYAAPDADQIMAVDEAQREHATSTADAGAALARELGATAEALSVPDSANIAATVVGIADQHDAAALVVGSRGLGAMKSRLLGSTSRAVLHETHRPVLIVRAAD